MLQNGACRPRPIVGFTARNNDIYIIRIYGPAFPAPLWCGGGVVLSGGGVGTLDHVCVYIYIYTYLYMYIYIYICLF